AARVYSLELPVSHPSSLFPYTTLFRSLAEVVRREVLPPDEHQRIAVDERHRGEVLLGVVGQLRVERDVGGDLQVVQQQRMAVGRGARDAAGADRGAAAAHVVDDEGLAELLAEAGGELPRKLVGRPAGGVWHDDRDGARRIVLRKRAEAEACREN